jgi:hypothetical protein
VVPIPDGFLSRKQVAELFRVDPQTLSHWVRAGKLEGSMHEGRWVFAADTVRALLGGNRSEMDWHALAERLVDDGRAEGTGVDGDVRPVMLPMHGVHARRPGADTTVCGKPAAGLDGLEPRFVNVNIVLRCQECEAALGRERRGAP